MSTEDEASALKDGGLQATSTAPASEGGSAGAPPPINGREIANGAVVLLLTKVAGLLLIWGLEVLLVRVLSHAEWDRMSRFLTLASVFTIAQFGFPESIFYFVAKKTSVATGLRLTARTSALLFAIGTCVCLPLFVVPGLAESLLGAGGEQLRVPLAVFATADLAFSPLSSFLLAQRKPKLASALSLGTRGAIALSVAGAAISGSGLRGAIFGMAIGALVALVAGWTVVLRTSRAASPRTTERVSLREQAAFSVPVGLTRFVQIGNVKLDKYIVMAVFSEGVFGTYYLGATEFPIPALVCTAAMNAMMPYLVEAAGDPDRTRMIALWHASIEKVALIALPLFAFLFAYADSIFTTIYGAEYRAASVQFRIFQLLLLARVTNYTYVSLSLGQPRVPLIAAGIALGLNAALSFVLVRTLGITGPAVANVTAVYFSSIYTLHAIRRGLGVSWREVFPLRRYARILGVALAAVVPALACRVLALPHAIELGLGAAVYLLSYILLASVTGVLGPADRAFLASVLRLEFLRSRPDPAPPAP